MVAIRMIEPCACLEEEDWGGNGDYLGDSWNPAHFGDVPRRCDPNGQLTIWFDSDEPPDPDDYQSLEVFETEWHEWEVRQVKA